MLVICPDVARQPQQVKLKDAQKSAKNTPPNLTAIFYYPNEESNLRPPTHVINLHMSRRKKTYKAWSPTLPESGVPPDRANLFVDLIYQITSR